ncbi:hypothetical protein BGX28_003314 [Mortierella sp. GBA30]|nr:hypothetical protein BGX28_003314 [Mortierella sp. GBA30]
MLSEDQATTRCNLSKHSATIEDSQASQGSLITKQGDVEQVDERQIQTIEGMDAVDGHVEVETNADDTLEKEEDVAEAHPASEGDDDDNEGDFVPDYILREIQEFEQGFNGLEGRFKLLDKIGEGTFSSVYKAIDLEHDLYDNSEWDYDMDEPAELSSSEEKALATAKPASPDGGKVVAIKRIYVTSSPLRIQNEIAILHDLSGHKNVVPLITAFRFKDQVIVVLPYFEHRDFREYYRDLPMEDIRCYFRALLKALAHVHSHKIIHRDIKPSNFLYDLRRKTGLLVDFGLAQREDDPTVRHRHPSTASSSASSSRGPSRSSHSAETRAKSTQNKENSAPSVHRKVDGTNAAAPGSTSSATGAIAPAAPGSRETAHRASVAIATGSAPLPAQMSASVGQPRSKTSGSVHQGSVVSQTAAAPQLSGTREGIQKTNASINATNVAPPSQSNSPLNYVRTPKTAGGATISHPSLLMTGREPGFPRKDTRPVMRVNRAGTRGFRAPEILFRHSRQTVAIDIWSVGVILFSFLTGRFPFFHSNDDAEALLEIAVLFGHREMRKAATKFNRTFVCNVPSIKENPVSFARVCRLLHPKRFGVADEEDSKQHGEASTSATAPSSAPIPASAVEATPTSTLPRKLTTGLASAATSFVPQPQLQAQHQSIVPLSAVSASSAQQQQNKQAPRQTNAVVEATHQRNTKPEAKSSPQPPQLGDTATNGPSSPLHLAERREDMESSSQGTHPKEDPVTTADIALAKIEQAVSEQSNKNADVSKGNRDSTEGDSNTQINNTTSTVKKKKPAVIGYDSQEDLSTAVHLLIRLLALDPSRRITAEEALQHPFLAEKPK